LRRPRTPRPPAFTARGKNLKSSAMAHNLPFDDVEKISRTALEDYTEPRHVMVKLA